MVVQPNNREEGVGASFEYAAALTSSVLAGFEVMLSQHSGDAEDIAHYNNLNVNISKWRVDAERSMRLLGKLSFAPSETSLFYIVAGINSVHFNYRETTLFGVGNGTVYDHSDTLTGHVVAVGFDQRVSESLSVRLELSHTELDDKIYQGGIFSSPTKISPDVRAANFGLGYHF